MKREEEINKIIKDEDSRIRTKISRMKYEAKNNKTEKRKKQFVEITSRSKKRYPERNKARLQLKYAISKGKVRKLPCVECMELKVEGHHIDYTKPFDVIWYCHKHHMIAHNRFIQI